MGGRRIHSATVDSITIQHHITIRHGTTSRHSLTIAIRGGAVKISELSADSGVSTATIKFYLREGLLHPGTLTSPTSAEYDETHLHRLRVVRAFLGPGRLSVSQVRAVLEILEEPPERPSEMMRRLIESLAPPLQSEVAHERGLGLLRDLGWKADPSSSDVTALGAAAIAIESAGIAVGMENLELYAGTAHRLAEVEVATFAPGGTDVDAGRELILGVALVEPLMLALRRLALRDAWLDAHGLPPTDSATGRPVMEEDR